MSAAEAVWSRKPRGGMRRRTPIRVTLVGRTPAGFYVVEYLRRHRRIRRVVAAENLTPVVDGATS